MTLFRKVVSLTVLLVIAIVSSFILLIGSKKLSVCLLQMSFYILSLAFKHLEDLTLHQLKQQHQKICYGVLMYQLLQQMDSRRCKLHLLFCLQTLLISAFDRSLCALDDSGFMAANENFVIYIETAHVLSSSISGRQRGFVLFQKRLHLLLRHETWSFL